MRFLAGRGAEHLKFESRIEVVNLELARRIRLGPLGAIAIAARTKNPLADARGRRGNIDPRRGDGLAVGIDDLAAHAPCGKPA